MEKVVKYQAINGATFDTPEECLAHEKREDVRLMIVRYVTGDAYLDPEEEDIVINGIFTLIDQGKITINLEVK